MKRTLIIDRQAYRWSATGAGPMSATIARPSPWSSTSPRSAARRAGQKELPDDAYADRGYGSEPLRALLRWLGIVPHIAKRRTPHGSGKGSVRWVVDARAICFRIWEHGPKFNSWA